MQVKSAALLETFLMFMLWLQGYPTFLPFVHPGCMMALMRHSHYRFSEHGIPWVLVDELSFLPIIRVHQSCTTAGTPVLPIYGCFLLTAGYTNRVVTCPRSTIAGFYWVFKAHLYWSSSFLLKTIGTIITSGIAV